MSRSVRCSSANRLMQCLELRMLLSKVGFVDDREYSDGNAAYITAAGHTPVRLTDSELTPATLATLDGLILGLGNEGRNSELLAKLPNVIDWVNGGGKLVIHDSNPAAQASQDVVPGLDGVTFVQSYSQNLDVLDSNSPIVNGPFGIVDDETLDGGSVHGYMLDDASLPSGVTRVLSAEGDSDRVAVVSYTHGAGFVVYAAIPVEYYTADPYWGPEPFTTNLIATYLPNELQAVLTSGAVPAGPAADAGGPYSADEGLNIDVQLHATSDTGPRLFEWDLDGDRNYGESGADAGNGDETGPNPVLHLNAVRGPRTLRPRLRVTDTSNNAVRYDIAKVQINDLPATSFISGHIFEDLNADGVQQADEHGAVGVSVTYSSDTGSSDSMSTDSDGNYTFGPLDADIYHLSIPSYGLIQTTPAPADITLDKDTTATADTVGVFKTFTIRGTVFDDGNYNGVHNNFENTVEGIAIHLDKDADGTVDLVGYSYYDGSYSFDGLGLGTYRVRVVLQENKIQTTLNPEDIQTSSGGSKTVDFGIAPALPSLSVSDVAITEGNSGLSPMVFFVKREGDTTRESTVDYYTSNSTATGGVDFDPVSGTLHFLPGQLAKIVVVQVHGDRSVESNEKFYLNLAAPGMAIITDGQAVGTIQNDDAAAPSVKISVVTDPSDGTKTALNVAGTSSADKIEILHGGQQGKASVTINGAKKGSFSFTGHILVYGGEGNDTIDVQNSITRGAIIFGEAGKDTANGGGGNDVILGGDADDRLNGRDGRDLLFGGKNTDQLAGGNGDDLLIGGTTSHDSNISNLYKLQKEWVRTDKSYATRTSNIRNGGGLNGSTKLNTSTVFSSSTVHDVLNGNGNNDLFFAAVPGDTSDKFSGESLVDVA